MSLSDAVEGPERCWAERFGSIRRENLQGQFVFTPVVLTVTITGSTSFPHRSIPVGPFSLLVTFGRNSFS